MRACVLFELFYNSLCQTEDWNNLTTDILFQKVKNDEPDNFHNKWTCLYNSFQKTHDFCYIIRDSF